MSVWERQLEWYVAVLAGIGAFFSFWLMLQIYPLAASASALLVGIFVWLIVHLCLGKPVNTEGLLQLVAVTFGLIISFYQIGQIGLQPRLDLHCGELTGEYPNLWAPDAVVLRAPDQSFHQVGDPILLMITNRGRATATNSRLYLSVDYPFLVSIFGIWSDEHWWSWVKEPQPQELVPEQFSWIAGVNYRRVTLTLSEILPGKSLEAYFLLIAPSDLLQEASTSVRARLTGINRPVEKEFEITWERGKMKCGS